ncbi:MAG: multidrug transporter AcrB [Candidatus Wallbacteria bacterium GWC2_49_35]|uniref:Multidrug transporter AcrB n=1 Tax=Candidatus Wallbacteria bacterium GWC2_49_35 TaxID=1817813 RepID=A0A1F7WZ31_9BACT|nr:MAG: multidrug transporter AcrB [Candidatus Wallbacteria bacterium GWC2_49_35]
MNLEENSLHSGFAGGLAKSFIDSKLTPLIILLSLLLGVFAIIMTPREEEPQIVVPMIDVFVQMPGASPAEVEKRVINPMEKLLWEIPGVEHIYSTAQNEGAMTIVRFKVSEDAEKSLVKIMEKMEHNKDRIPPNVYGPYIKSRSIDDVPILALTLHSKTEDHYMLRRAAAQLTNELKSVNDVSDVNIIGGQRREIRVEFDPNKLSAYGISPMEIVGVISDANQQSLNNSFKNGNLEFKVTIGNFFRSVDDVKKLVVRSVNKRAIYLEEIAKITDDVSEPENYVLFKKGPATKTPAGKDSGAAFENAVTIALSKRKGTNAIVIAEEVLDKLEKIRGTLLSKDVEVTVTRNYGETASEKSNELLYHMALATISVTILIWMFLGFKASAVVAIAIPVTLALTLLVFYLYGYTLNRITLFALIFSIGILVDDAIVVVENMVRHFHLPRNKGRNMITIAVESVAEVGNPTILATIAVIVAILPMAFVSGLMGPYMRPIPVGASAAMIFSLIVAFIVTPWSSIRILNLKEIEEGGGHHEGANDDFLTRLYHRIMEPVLTVKKYRYIFLASVTALLLITLLMVPARMVKVKMLPFDNKSEFQVIIDMPEGTTLEQTTEVTKEIARYAATIPEVSDLILYPGTAAPHNFNGLVRHYFMRSGQNVSDIQVNLAAKHDRKRSSHEIAVAARPEIQKIARKYKANVKVAEVPPGPPVLQTLVAEIYGPDYETVKFIAGDIAKKFAEVDGVVDIDTYVEDTAERYLFNIDQEKASLNGLSYGEVLGATRLGLSGQKISLMHDPEEIEDVYINVTPPEKQRSSVESILNMHAFSRMTGRATPLAEIITVKKTVDNINIYHKNLKTVSYVVADVAGSEESPVYPILKLRELLASYKTPSGPINQYTFTTKTPENTSLGYFLKWDGEWHITVEVFRDLGLAFAIAMIMIYILVVGWFQSFKTPLVIMAPIPLTLVGILPAHYFFGAFFTATSMIGFIAGAGIIVRNSIILVDFINLKVAEGLPLKEAVVEAGSIRFRPMLLTAAAVVVGSFVMLFDPIFQGLAISLMAGEIASTLLSRMTVPVLYFMSESKE